GLFWKRPYLTAVLTLMLLSLAGIPLTAGFIGKFYVFAVGVESSLWWLLGAVVVGSAIGIFYYLRVVVTLYMASPSMRRHDAPLDWAQGVGGIMVLLLGALTLFLGVYPQPALDIIRLAEMALTSYARLLAFPLSASGFHLVAPHAEPDDRRCLHLSELRSQFNSIQFNSIRSAGLSSLIDILNLSLRFYIWLTFYSLSIVLIRYSSCRTPSCS